MARSRALLVVVLALAAAAAGDAQAAQWPAISEAVGNDVAPVAPALVTRAQWQAKPALAGMKPQRPTGIIIHHTGERQNPRTPVERKLQGLQSFSQRPGQVGKRMKPAWPDVPYHFYIDVSGRIAEGRDVRFAGDTNTGYDPSGYIQVVVEGEFGRETPTAGELASTSELVAALMLLWNVPIERVTVHKDHAQTECPGRNFMAVLPRVLADAEKRRSAAVTDLCRRGASADFTRLYCRAR